jgi:GT2 family glycosyltransferase
MNGSQLETRDRSDSMLRNLSTPIAAKPVLDDISVVIPTLGRPILESCLRWLADGSHWPNRVIIVDQGRNPVAAKWLEQLQAAGLNTLYVPSGQKGRSAGINRGLEQVATRFVAVTDDDCFVAPDWLEIMTRRLRSEPNVIFTGRVEYAGNDMVEFSTVTSREPKLFTRPQLKVYPFIGGNAGMAMTLVEKVGLFDEHPCLSSAEDSDYGYRALRLGIPIAYDPDVVLYHYHWRDASQRAARYADYARSQGGFYGTHLRHGDMLVFAQTALAMVRSPVRWLRGIVKRDKELMENGRAHTLNLPRGIIAGLQRKDL